MTEADHSPPRPHFPVRTPILAGWIIVAAFLLTVTAWASVAPLASAVIASGEIVVEGSRKVVQHLEGGILSAVLVKDGDRVRKNQPLAELDQTEAQSRLAVIKKRIDVAAASSARLRAERDGLADVAFPESLKSRADDPWVADLLQRQVELFEGRRAALLGQIGLLDKQMETLRQQMVGTKAQQAGTERQLVLIRKEHEGLQWLYEQGYAPRTRLFALERAEAQLEGDRGNQVSDIAKTQKEVGEAEMKVAQVKKEFFVRAVDELTEIEKSLADLPDQEKAAAEVVRRAIVLAPSDGVVLSLAVHTPGEVIPPGGKILEIVPQTEGLIVKATIPLKEISKVQVGQEADVRLTSLNTRTTPTIKGRVTYLSADRLQFPDDKTAHYEVRVLLDSDGLAQLDNATLVPGMPAEVFIHSGSRTFFQYVAKPMTDAFYRTMREK